mmetsp:Transcript_124325/g.333812  ORF Transcript_124325/g.333812 Transcript_124325/m.333812 type:complete len:103 (-) Transcript_124325:163-471(-)
MAITGLLPVLLGLRGVAGMQRLSGVPNGSVVTDEAAVGLSRISSNSSNGATCAVTMYQHGCGGGFSATYGVGSHSWVGSSHNDQYSAMYISTDACRVVIYQH